MVRVRFLVMFSITMVYMNSSLIAMFGFGDRSIVDREAELGRLLASSELDEQEWREQQAAYLQWQQELEKNRAKEEAQKKLREEEQRRDDEQMAIAIRRSQEDQERERFAKEREQAALALELERSRIDHQVKVNREEEQRRQERVRLKREAWVAEKRRYDELLRRQNTERARQNREQQQGEILSRQEAQDLAKAMEESERAHKEKEVRSALEKAALATAMRVSQRDHDARVLKHQQKERFAAEARRKEAALREEQARVQWQQDRLRQQQREEEEKRLIKEAKLKELQAAEQEQRPLAEEVVPATQEAVLETKQSQAVKDMPLVVNLSRGQCIPIEVAQLDRTPFYNLAHYASVAQGQTKACGYFAAANGAALYDMFNKQQLGLNVGASLNQYVKTTYQDILKKGLALSREPDIDDLQKDINTDTLLQKKQIYMLNVVPGSPQNIGFESFIGEEFHQSLLKLMTAWKQSDGGIINLIMLKLISSRSDSGHYVLLSLFKRPGENSIHFVYMDAKNGPLTKDNIIVPQLDYIYNQALIAYEKVFGTPSDAINYICPININELIERFKIGFLRGNARVLHPDNRRDVKVNLLDPLIKDKGKQVAVELVDRLVKEGLITQPMQEEFMQFITEHVPQ